MEKEIKSRIKYFIDKNIPKSEGIKLLKKEFGIDEIVIMDYWFDVKSKKYPIRKRTRLKDDEYIKMKVPKKHHSKVMKYLKSLEIK